MTIEKTLKHLGRLDRRVDKLKSQIIVKKAEKGLEEFNRKAFKDAAQYESFVKSVPGKSFTFLGATQVKHKTSWEDLIDEMPELPNIIPHWIVEQDALNEMKAFAETDEGKAFLNDQEKYYPLPEGLIVEFKQDHYSFVVVYVKAHTRAYNYIMKHDTNLKSGDPVMLHQDKTFIAIYANEQHLEWIAKQHPGQQAAAAAQRMVHDTYSIRMHFASRYIDIAESHRATARVLGKHSAGVRIITVYWDAPTPRYNHKTNPDRVPTGIHMPEHRVREHLRRYSSGRVAIVKSHVRGDATVARKTQTRIIGHGEKP